MNTSAPDFTLDDMRSAGSSGTASKDTETTVSVSWMGGGQVKESNDCSFENCAKYTDILLSHPRMGF